MRKAVEPSATRDDVVSRWQGCLGSSETRSGPRLYREHLRAHGNMKTRRVGKVRWGTLTTHYNSPHLCVCMCEICFCHVV